MDRGGGELQAETVGQPTGIAWLAGVVTREAT